MSDCGTTNMAGKFYISTTVQNNDLTLSQFQALTWVPVANMGNMGDTGVSQNVVTYSTWDRNVLCKGKGEADAGTADVEFLDVPSAGIDLMLAAAAVNNQGNYGFKVEWSDGSAEYNRGLVTGPARPKGGNEDFKRLVFTLGMQQEPETSPAVSS